MINEKAGDTLSERRMTHRTCGIAIADAPAEYQVIFSEVWKL